MKDILGLILFAGIIGMFSGCQTAARPDNSTVRSLNATEASSVIDKIGPVIIDVRTPSEYNEGHLKNSVNIDFLAADFKTRLSKQNRDKPVFVYCKSGKRSKSSLEVFQALGFKEVYTLSKGLNEWVEAGLPIEK